MYVVKRIQGLREHLFGQVRHGLYPLRSALPYQAVKAAIVKRHENLNGFTSWNEKGVLGRRPVMEKKFSRVFVEAEIALVGPREMSGKSHVVVVGPTECRKVRGFVSLCGG